MNNYIERLKEALEHDFYLPDHATDYFNLEILMDAAKAYVTLLESQDYKIVPVIPTNEMLKDGFIKSRYDEGFSNREDVYQAMLAAVPPYNPENSE